jgi:tetratricopeptide (TPR) repeat protein
LRLFLSILAALFLLIFTVDIFALTPAADLSGKWSGTVQMQDSYGYCAYIGSVTAELRQSGNTLDGSYVFTVTSAKPTGRLEGLESCSIEPYSGSVSGTFDGSLVILHDSDGLGFSGSATSDMMTLNFSDSYVIGTAKLQKFADFSKPGLTQPSEQSVDELLQTGLSYLNEKRFDKALEYFSKIIGQDPNNIMGWMGKGVSYVGLKNYDQAITHFKKSLEISPNNKDALQWLARAYYLKGDCQSASIHFSQALRVDPQNTKFIAEKKIIDACLAKQTAAKKPEPKPETKPDVAKPVPTKPETKPTVVKLDAGSIKSTLDKIKDPKARAQKALEILNQLPAGPIPDDLQKLFADKIYRNVWMTRQDKELLIDKLPELFKTFDGSINQVKPTGRTFSEKPAYFVNGIMNSPDEADQNAQALANMLERPVKRIYNKSDGFWADIFESGKLKAGMLNDNPSVQTLVNSIIGDLKRGERVEIHAHSEGALITSVALGIIQESDPDFFAKNADKITVNTYGGASYTYPKGPAYDHVAFVTDPVSWAFGSSNNLLFKTNPEKITSVPGHAFTGYVHDKPRAVINEHIPFLFLDTMGLGKDLVNYNPKMVSSVLLEVGNNREEVAYHYVANLDDDRLKSLPKDQLGVLQKILNAGSIKESDDTQLKRLNQIMGMKK